LAERRCAACGAVLASTSRPDRRYCNSGCRVAEHRRRRDVLATRVTRDDLARLLDRLAGPAGEAALVAGITRAASEHWAAAAWLLERRWPERWGLSQRARIATLDEDGGDLTA
jgi:hypothetical protein